MLPDLDLTVAKAFKAQVRVTEQGMMRRISKYEAAVIQLVNKAASGHIPSLKLLLPSVAQSKAEAVDYERIRNDVRARVAARLDALRQAQKDRDRWLAGRKEEQDRQEGNGDQNSS